MSKKITTWMPFYVGDYLKDTRHLTTEQHGAYDLLIMEHWNAGSLPDDDGMLARLSKLTPARFAKHSAILRGFFYPDGGRLFHKRVLRELELAKDKQAKASESANKRWGNK